MKFESRSQLLLMGDGYALPETVKMMNLAKVIASCFVRAHILHQLCA